MLNKKLRKELLADWRRLLLETSPPKTPATPIPAGTSRQFSKDQAMLISTPPKAAYGTTSEDLVNRLVDPSHKDHFVPRSGIHCRSCSRKVPGHIMATDIPARRRKIQCLCGQIWIVRYDENRWPIEYLHFKKIIKFPAAASTQSPPKGA